MYEWLDNTCVPNDVFATQCTHLEKVTIPHCTRSDFVCAAIAKSTTLRSIELYECEYCQRSESKSFRYPSYKLKSALVKNAGIVEVKLCYWKYSNWIEALCYLDELQLSKKWNPIKSLIFN